MLGPSLVWNGRTRTRQAGDDAGRIDVHNCIISFGRIRKADVTERATERSLTSGGIGRRGDGLADATAPVRTEGHAGGFVPIMGEPAAAAARMEAFVLGINPAPKLPYCTVRELAEMFLEEGLAEGVRGDVAWAQAIQETGYFKYGRIVTPDMNNYSGIGALYEDRPGFGARFDSPRLGVRAQVQHLKAYATTEPLAGQCVDPRFDLVLRGTAPYVEWLGAADNPTGRGWAFPGDGYGAHIVAILRRMLEG